MGLEALELFALALAPIIFLFTYVYLSDKYEREPLVYLVITFFLGVIIALPAYFLSLNLNELLGVSPYRDSNIELFVYCFVVIAFSEELMKFLVLRFYNFPHKEFDEPYDGIMYGVAVSLGFAAIENVLYVFNAEGATFDNISAISEVDGGGIELGIVRMFTAVPAHAIFGVLMGFFVGKAKFLTNKKDRFWTIALGFFSAVFFHGVYNFMIYKDTKLFYIFAFVSLAVGIILAKVAMHNHAEHSPHRFAQPEDKEQDTPSDDTSST